MAALRNLFSTSIFSPIASLWKKKMPKDNHDPPPTPNTVEIPMQPLIRSSRADDVIHGDVVADVGAPLAPIAPTVNIDSSSKHIQKMVVAVAIFLMTFAGLLIVNPPDASQMSNSLAESMASISNVLILVTFGFGACLILHTLLCLHSSDHLNHIRVQKHLMLMGVVFMALSLLFRTLVTPSGTPLVLGSWILALLIVVLAFAFLRMVSYAGMAAPSLAAGGLDNLPV